MSELAYSEHSTDGVISGSYRSISRAAVISVCMAVLGISGFLFSLGGIFSLMGIFSALYSLYVIKKYPEELTGAGVGKLGLVLSSLLFLSTTSLHTYIYLTEVPPEHVRLTFGDIESPKYRKYQPTETAVRLNGEQVFIKGYTFPGKQRKNLTQFLLVGDFGQCCFGGNPEPSHLVRVSIKNGQKIDYSQRLRKLTGTFRVLSSLAKDKEGQGYLYEIVDADVIK